MVTPRHSACRPHSRRVRNLGRDAERLPHDEGPSTVQTCDGRGCNPHPRVLPADPSSELAFRSRSFGTIPGNAG